MNRKYGFSLLELMIASGLSSLLLLLLAKSYLAALQTYQWQCAMNELHEKHYFLKNFWDQQFSKIGYQACETPKIEHLHVFQASEASTLPINILHHHLPAQAILAIVFTKPFAEVNEQISANKVFANLLTMPSSAEWLIHDCENHESFFGEIKKINTHQVNIQSRENFENKYNEKATLSIWQQQFYYLAKTGRFDLNHQPIYALFQSNGVDDTLEVVDGINAFSLEFSSCESPTLFKPAAVFGKNQICHIKVNATLRSIALVPQFPTMSAKPLEKSWHAIYSVHLQ